MKDLQALTNSIFQIHPRTIIVATLVATALVTTSLVVMVTTVNERSISSVDLASESEGRVESAFVPRHPEVRRSVRSQGIGHESRATVPGAEPKTTTANDGRPAQDEVPEEPQEVEDVSELEFTSIERAVAELENLEKQDQTAFLQLFDFLKESGEYDAASVDTARRRTWEYILARSELIKIVLRSFIDSSTEYDHTEDLLELAQLENAYKREMMEIDTEIPGLAMIHEMLGGSSLQLPSFIQERTAGGGPSVDVNSLDSFLKGDRDA